MYTRNTQKEEIELFYSKAVFETGTWSYCRWAVDGGTVELTYNVVQF
jgi:hypothetical protein